MLSRVTSSVTNLLKSKAPQESPANGVPELLAILAGIRARRAELDREEKEVLAATRAKFREQQEALEELKKKVHESGIELHDEGPAPYAPSQQLSDEPAAQPALSNH